MTPLVHSRVIRLGDAARQNVAVATELQEAVSRVMQSGRYIGGPEVEAFEGDFAEFCGTQTCVAVGNGTDALEIILDALGIGPGCRVLMPAMSFAATCEAVLRVGAVPVFVDTDEHGICDAEALLAASSTSLASVIAVHLYGYPVNARRLFETLQPHGIRVIEDAAQGHGGQVSGQAIGGLGDAAAFSFYPGKNLGALGDAGAIVAREPSLAEVARRLGNHGRLGKFDHDILGRNSRLDALQAAILSVKLKHLPAWLERRRMIAKHYLERLKDLPWLTLPRIPEREDLHAWHLFPLTTVHRDELRAHLGAQGIETGIHYPLSLPELPYLEQQPSAFPNARRVARRTLSIPVGEHLTDSDVTQVVDSLRHFKPSRSPDAS